MSIVEHVYLGGVNLAFGPEEVQETPIGLWEAGRFADTTAYSDQPIGWDGAPSSHVKRVFAMKWPQSGSEDHRAFARVAARRAPVDLCLWSPVSAYFSSDGARTRIVLPWRLALNELADEFLLPNPTACRAKFATEVLVAGTPMAETTDYLVRAPDEVGHTPIDFTSPLPEGDETVEVYGVPLYLVRMQAPPQATAQLLGMSNRSITFEEQG